MATKDYYLAYFDSLPQVIQRHMFFNADFMGWSGLLTAIDIAPSPFPKFAAQVTFTIQRRQDTTELTYLLGPTCYVQPVIKKDLSNMSAEHLFRTAVEEWVQEISHKQRSEAIAQTRALKEELMAAAWAPARVAKWVAAGRYDMLD